MSMIHRRALTRLGVDYRSGTRMRLDALEEARTEEIDKPNTGCTGRAQPCGQERLKERVDGSQQLIDQRGRGR